MDDLIAEDAHDEVDIADYRRQVCLLCHACERVRLSCASCVPRLQQGAGAPPPVACLPIDARCPAPPPSPSPRPCTRPPQAREAEAQAARDSELDAEQVEEFVRERYANRRYEDAGDDFGDDSAVAQQALVPTHQDPKLWLVHVAEGQERELVVCILQKCYDYAAKGAPLLIKAAFCQDHIKARLALRARGVASPLTPPGALLPPLLAPRELNAPLVPLVPLQGYIYVEAFKETHVRDALRGFRMVFHSKQPKLVALGEMVDAITVAPTTAKSIGARAPLADARGVGRGGCVPGWVAGRVGGAGLRALPACLPARAGSRWCACTWGSQAEPLPPLPPPTHPCLLGRPGVVGAHAGRAVQGRPGKGGGAGPGVGARHHQGELGLGRAGMQVGGGVARGEHLRAQRFHMHREPSAAAGLSSARHAPHLASQLVPRLDFAAIANRKPEDVRANFGKAPKVVPPARPFNPDEAS